LKPTGIWSKKEDENKVSIIGISDSDYSKVIETRRSVTGILYFSMDYLLLPKARCRKQ
jgi:hypothetical protein